MKKPISQILIVLFLTVAGAAQMQTQKPVPFDQLGSFPLDELMGRLDNFIFALRQKTEAKGVIRIYGDNENCFGCRYGFGSLVNAYLQNTRKFSSANYSVEYCDGETNEEHRTELYLLSPGESLAKCRETLESPKNSSLFETIYFYYKDDTLSTLESAYIEIGPTQGLYSANVLKKAKEILGKNPASKLYVIAYLGTNKETKAINQNGKMTEKLVRNPDKKSRAKKLLSIAKKELGKNGINLSQIETIEGGYIDERRRLEFWLVPANGAIPKPEPNYFPAQQRND